MRGVRKQFLRLLAEDLQQISKWAVDLTTESRRYM